MSPLRATTSSSCSPTNMLSVGCCFDISRTALGTARSIVRSISVVHLSLLSLLLLVPFFRPFAAAAVTSGDKEPLEDATTAEDVGCQCTMLCQQSSKCASTRPAGMSFTLVHSSCSCKDGSYQCTTSSTKKCSLPSQLWSRSFTHGDKNEVETVCTSLCSMIAHSISPSLRSGPPLHVTMVLSYSSVETTLPWEQATARVFTNSWAMA